MGARTASAATGDVKPPTGAALARILVAADGERESSGAVRVAAALARRPGTSVSVVAVVTPFPHSMASVARPDQPVAIDDRSRREMRDRVERHIRDVAGDDGWPLDVVVGWPPDAINAAARRCGATLIVLGIGRHRRVDRLFGSETAIAVMRHAAIPVLAVAPSARGLPKAVLAAVDFTEASDSAAELALQLMQRDGTLMLAHASSFVGRSHALGGLADLYTTGARTKLEAARRRLRRRSRAKIATDILEGEAGQALLRAARERDADLIALGGHEQGLMDRILLGSVRTRVVRAATCSVLIAPPRAG